MASAQNEKGSALVTILLVVVVTMVLGTALLTLTLNSHRTVVASENQSKARHLAEVAVKAGHWDLQKELESFTSNNWADVVTKIDWLENNFSISPVNPDPTRTEESYQYRLFLNNSNQDMKVGDMELAHRVMNPDQGIYIVNGYLEGTGTANGRTATIRMPVQISSLAEVFNVSMSASETIWLNGGVRINGDLYAGTQIALHKIAHFSWNGHSHEESVYPEVNGKISAGENENEENNIYHIPEQRQEHKTSVGNHDVQSTGVRIDPSQLQIYLNGHFELSKIRNIELPTINFSDKRNEIRSKAASDPNYHYKTAWYFDWFSWGWKETFTTFEIGSNSENGTGPFDGIWYVHGDLIVDGNVELNGTFYVEGDVTIRNIKTTNPIAAVIIANGQIDVYNNNLFQSSPAVLNAFLWTQQDELVIYGVASNLQINGGVIAKNIILNGVRGNTTKKGNGNGSLKFDTQTLDKYPRLTITYDPKFILNPPAGVPTIKGLKVTQTGKWQVVN